jgi:Asp-tRNA(Asn)/Glu-tRNA(Gln) amidotransferase A subunit family amidase
MFVRPDVVKTVTNEVVTAEEFGGASPVGMMLIGEHFEEPIIYRGVAAFESAGDRTKM